MRIKYATMEDLARLLRLRQNAFHLRKQQQKRNLLIESDIMEIIFGSCMRAKS